MINFKVLVAKRFFLRKEAYFAILLDRKYQGPIMIASSQGGVDIEKVALENPEAIIKVKKNEILSNHFFIGTC